MGPLSCCAAGRWARRPHESRWKGEPHLSFPPHINSSPPTPLAGLLQRERLGAKFRADVEAQKRGSVLLEPASVDELEVCYPWGPLALALTC